MNVFRTISSIVLALMVLVSSTSFIIGMHICNGAVKDISLFTKADGCEKEKSTPPCHRHMKRACCEDEAVFHEGDDFKASIEHVQIIIPAPIDIEHPTLFISEIIPDAPISRTNFYNYDPPLRSWDLTVEHHVFLI
jgi:hypothetical protein